LFTDRQLRPASAAGPSAFGRQAPETKSETISRRIVGALAVAMVPVFVGLIGVGLVVLRSWMQLPAS
jgi:hypothetical protein